MTGLDLRLTDEIEHWLHLRMGAWINQVVHEELDRRGYPGIRKEQSRKEIIANNAVWELASRLRNAGREATGQRARPINSEDDVPIHIQFWLAVALESLRVSGASMDQCKDPNLPKGPA